MNKSTVLVAAYDSRIKQAVKRVLGFQKVDVVEASGYQESLCLYAELKPQLLVLEAPGLEGSEPLSLAEHIHQRDRRFPIILVTSRGSKSLVISALRAGLKDYFELPFSSDEFAESVKRYLRGRSATVLASKGDQGLDGHPRLIGCGAAMTQLRGFLHRVAKVDSNVLITGETGTGKEISAHMIHRQSSRAHKPFIAINCAALPDSLLESELFGYEKGAFTGAQTSFLGKLKMADGGSVFFDEIGDMSAFAQAKILRVLESKEVYPLGGKRSLPLDIRIIAATNRNLETMVQHKEFREDLYFRLNVARVRLPPLRERKEDIPELLDFYRQFFNQSFNKYLSGFGAEALSALHEYHWPGNIRELKNLLESIYIDSGSEHISLNDLPEPIRGKVTVDNFSSQTEREQMLEALISVNWNKSKAAEQLQWSRMTLYRKMEKYNINGSQAADLYGSQSDRMM